MKTGPGGPATSAGLDTARTQCGFCGAKPQDRMCQLLSEGSAPDSGWMQVVTCGRHSVLYTENQIGEHVFVVRQGLVELARYLPNGTTRIVRVLQRGDVAGLESVLLGRYRHTALAPRGAQLCRLDAAAFRRLGAQRPELYLDLCLRWQRNLDAADFALTHLSTGSTEARVARLLLHVPRCNGEPGEESGSRYALTREDMSALLGVTRESVSRAVAQFKRQGWVRESGGCCQVDEQALEKVALDEA
jgi:CRP-like cAMP-binding protein